jgi:antitoxin component YwqK of YwqJK toxin-antitoxin module
MLKHRNIIILFLALFLASCTGNVVEEVVENHPDGTPKLVRYYEQDGNIRDLVREIQYYPNHQKFYEGEFKNNKKHGDWKVWYQNGNVWSEGSYKEGLDEGDRTGYYEDGKVHFKGQYSKGKMTGTWSFYDESGKLVKEIDYDKQQQ